MSKVHKGASGSIPTVPPKKCEKIVTVAMVKQWH